MNSEYAPNFDDGIYDDDVIALNHSKKIGEKEMKINHLIQMYRILFSNIF